MRQSWPPPRLLSPRENTELAFHHPAGAHILSQRHTIQHVYTDWLMLKLGPRSVPNAKAPFLRQITAFEEEFLAHVVLPNGKGTVGDWLMPQIDYQSDG